MATYTGTPRTWVAGETVTAALMNSDIRDPLAALAGAWNSYTPTLTQGVTVTKTTSTGSYLQFGKLVIASIGLSPTSAGTAGQAIVIGLPVTAKSQYVIGGSGNVFDGSAGLHYGGAVELQPGGVTAKILYPGGGAIGANPNFAIAATGDYMAFLVIYEAA